MIYETETFTVKLAPKPFVDRDEGGHIIIGVKDKIKDRKFLTPKQNVELAWLTSLTGEAYWIAMKKRGVDIIKINYQDMGNWYYKNKNWEEHLHVHIFGRVLNAPHQPFPESVYLPDRSSGFYDNFKPITPEDETAIQNEITALLATEKYKIDNWRF